MLQKFSHFMREANLINGEWVQADSGQTIDVTNPATGLKLGTVPKSGKAETKRAIEAAEAAFHVWRKTSALERSNLLRKDAEFYAETAADVPPDLPYVWPPGHETIV